MAEWLDYSLADFLLFAPGTFWRLFELMNAAIWPLTLLVPAVLAGVAVTAVLGRRPAAWAVGLTLASSWAGLALLFLGTHYAPINWAVSWIIPFAWVQATLTIALVPGLRFDPRATRPWLAYGFIAVAMAYPIIGVLAGRPFAQAEIAGLAPDPTALLTVGLLGLVRPNWRLPVLLVLPTGWMLFSAATLFAMDEPSAWVIAAALPMVLWIGTRKT